MNKITEITRRDIFDAFKNGFVINLDEPYKDHVTMELIDSVEVKMSIFGRITELEFLERLYNLNEMPSFDSRYKTAEGDIWQHTINNDDWPPYWFLNDDRFCLGNNYSDEYLLKFMCEILHPVVRNEKSQWREYLKYFNELLKVDGYELVPKGHISGREIFEAVEIDRITIKKSYETIYSSLKLQGEGSYAKVFKFKDDFYNVNFALKRAKKDLDVKELERFKLEFNQMEELSSPYIIKVYSYNESENEYIMEYMDGTLENYIAKKNSDLSLFERQTIIFQIIKAYKYLHSKNIFHRDVSFKNVLYKSHDDITIFKISDFGLVKIENSELTSENTELKGCLNDPSLKTRGFSKYDLLDEIYALTLLFCFIITGKTNFSNIKDENIRIFMEKGTMADRTKRYQNLDELQKSFVECISKLKDKYND